MFKIALLNLLDSRYDSKEVAKSYQVVLSHTPKNINETLQIHMEKLSDILDNYSEDRGYDLRNLISYHILPLI